MTKKKDKTPKQRKFEILRTGSFTDANGRDVVITMSDLQQLANNYSVETFRSPLVAGHPKDNEGALGWVDSLIVVNDRLYALVTQVHKNLAKAIKQGLYKKISISIFGAKSPANPIPGELYLRHVGILGAVAPAVSGLEEIEMKDTAQLLELDISFSEHQSKNEPTEETDVDPEEELKKLKADLAKANTDLAASQAQVKTLEADIAQLKKDADDRAEKQRIKEINDFCDQAVKDKHILPRDRDMHAEIMKTLSTEDIEFSEKKTNALEMYKDNLKSKKVNIDFSEKGADTDGHQEPDDEEALVAKMNELQEKGMTASEAADKLGIEL